MKKTFLSLMALTVSLLLPAQLRADTQETTEVRYLVVTETDGTTSQFALTDAPVITFNGDQLVVTCAGDELSLALSSVKDYHFYKEEVVTDIDDALAEPNTDGETKPTIAFGEAKFSGLKEGTLIVVYSIEGRAVATVTAGNGGNATIDLRSLPWGVYILRTPSNSYKIYNR